MWSLQNIAALLTALGVGSAMPVLIKGAMAHYSGRAERERSAMQTAIAERDAAWHELAAKQERLLVMKEYASRLRRVAIEHGIPEGHIPAWPEKPPPPKPHD